MTEEALYKVTLPSGLPPIANSTEAWPLPTQLPSGKWRAGKWWTVKGDLKMCRNGLHVTDARHLGHYAGAGLAVWRVEVRGERLGEFDSGPNGDKIVVRSARLLYPLSVLLTTPEDRRLRLSPTEWVARKDRGAWAKPPAEPEPKLVFGIDRVEDDRDARATGWPTQARWHYLLDQRTIRKMNRLLDRKAAA